MDRKVILTDGFIRLRPEKMSDVEAMFAAVRESIAEVSPWLPFCHADYAIEETRDWVAGLPAKWENGTAFEFAIFDVESGEYLGGCGLNRVQPEGLANLGYWVRTSRTKKGVATAATRLLARFGFEQLKLNRIEIVVDVKNLASQRVAARVGATREGIMRNRLQFGGLPSDAFMHSLIPGDMERYDG